MTRKFRSRLRAAVLALAILAPVTASFAQSSPGNGVVSQTFSLTRVGQGPIIPLTGQSSCSIVIDNAGSGLTLVPQSTSATNPNPSSQWVTATTVNSGSISGAGTFVGNVAGIGLTGFSFYVTALSSGTVSGSISCSPAVSPAGGGGVTGNVNVVNTPGVTVQNTPGVSVVNFPAAWTTSSPLPNAPQCVYNATPPALLNGQQVQCQVDSQGRQITAPQAVIFTTPMPVAAGDGTGLKEVNSGSLVVTPQDTAGNSIFIATSGLSGGIAAHPAQLVGAYMLGNDGTGTYKMPFVDANGVQRFVSCAPLSTTCAGPTAAGASAANAIPIQGVTGGVPVPVTTPVPGPTDANSVPYVHPTSVPTSPVYLCNSAGSTCTDALPWTNNGGNLQKNSIATDSDTLIFNPSNATFYPVFNAQGTGAANGVPAIGYNASGADSPLICKSAAFATITTATTTQLVAAVTNKRIFVCGVTISSVVTAASTVQLVRGTQATNPCDTSQANVQSPIAFATGTATASVGYGMQLAGAITGQSEQLCAVTTGTLTDVYVTVMYTQI